MEILASFVSL